MLPSGRGRGILGLAHQTLAGSLCRDMSGSPTSWGSPDAKGQFMAARPKSKPRRGSCAPRWRRLLFEAFEPRQMLATGVQLLGPDNLTVWTSFGGSFATVNQATFFS